MKKNLLDYTDSEGWIGHYEVTKTSAGVSDFKLEFGDGLQRTSMNYLFDFALATCSMDLLRARVNMKRIAHQIYLDSGEPVRHWSRNGDWYTSPGTMSGDQIEPFLWACVAMDLHAPFWKMILKLTRRGFFAWNTKKIGQMGDEEKLPDFMLFRMIGPILRMLPQLPIGWWILLTIVPTLLLVWVWDLVWLLPNTLVRTLYPLYDREDTSDDLNFTCSLVGMKLSYSTPISWFFTLLYVGLRPLSRLSGEPGFDQQQVGLLGAQSAFNQYFYNDFAPPLNEKAFKVILWL